jgi:hypothetical protein
MLARVPAGDLIDRTRHEPKLRAAEVLHSDTAWRPCTVLAWARHRDAWAVLIRWRDGHEDWREYDPRHIRPSDGPALGRRAYGRASRRHTARRHTVWGHTDHTEPDWADQVRAAAPGGVNLVLEAVGGQMLHKSIELLAPSAVWSSSAPRPGKLTSVPVRNLFAMKSVTGFSLTAWRAANAERARADISELTALFLTGRLRAPPPTPASR